MVKMNEDERNQSNIQDIQYTMLFNAPIEKVWQAISTSGDISKWHTSNTFNPQEGSQFTFSSQPMQNWDGVIQSTLVDFIPLTKLSYTWSTNVIKEELLVNFELKGKGTQTELEFSHTGWSKCTPDKMFVRNIVEYGWINASLENLKKLVEG
jgi:uncharacterized protein YndB with AHSA1/START domain